MQSPNYLRRRWLERQLEAFGQDEVAAVGGRVRAAVCPESATDPYEIALSVTLDVFKFRASRPSSVGVLRLRAGRVLTDELDPWGIAAGGVYASAACHITHSLSGLIMEPVGA